MKIKMLGRCLATVVAVAMVPWAVSQEVVLKNSEVNESSLIEALSIDEAGPAEGGLTRGFKPATASAAAPSKPAGAGKANLLITFLTNSAELTQESQTALDTVARALQSDALAKLTFRVEGHADARGNSELNQRLSEARAQAVTRYLVDKHGILAERLHPEGRGSGEPLNRRRVDAPENRRVTLVTIRN